MRSNGKLPSPTEISLALYDAQKKINDVIDMAKNAKAYLSDAGPQDREQSLCDTILSMQAEINRLTALKDFVPNDRLLREQEKLAQKNANLIMELDKVRGWLTQRQNECAAAIDKVHELERWNEALKKKAGRRNLFASRWRK